jgi:hypothetical protein
VSDDPSLRETARFLAMMYLAGWIDKPALIDWADSVLIAQPKPDPALVELSMSGQKKPHEILDCLGDVPGLLRAEVPVKMLFAFADVKHEVGQIAASEIASTLLRFFDGGLYGSELPQEVMQSIYDCRLELDLVLYDASMGREVGSGLDRALGSLFDWGRPYRDTLAVQCFPSGPDHTIDGHDC